LHTVGGGGGRAVSIDLRTVNTEGRAHTRDAGRFCSCPSHAHPCASMQYVVHELLSVPLTGGLHRQGQHTFSVTDLQLLLSKVQRDARWLGSTSGTHYYLAPLGSDSLEGI